MTWKDKAELGLKPDAPFRKDNLPDFQVEGAKTKPAGQGRSPDVPRARQEANRSRKAAKKGSVVQRPKPPARARAAAKRRTR
jgi:hypothetical protein